MAHRNIPVIEPQSEPDFRIDDARSTGTSSRSLARLQLLWDNRLSVFRFAVRGLLLSVIIAFAIPSKYDSYTKLMPPDSTLPGASMLASLLASRGGGESSGSSSVSGSGLGGYVTDFLGVKSSGALFIGVLRSRSVEDALVNRFDLRKVYWDSRMEDARKDLEDRTSVTEDRKSGIITISVRDHNKQRAQAMAQAYVDQLNIVIATVSTSSARREREFLETRLKAVKQELDQAAQQFSQFASQNTAIDITEQSKAMVEAAARLQGQLMASEAQAQGLEQIYTANNPRVRAARANIEELRRQLDQLGAGTQSGQPNGGTPLYPSIRQLPLLGVKYTDLYRHAKLEEAVFETLTKQYELAKVQEAKEIPTVKILDAPSYPEKKASPPRISIIILGFIVALVSGCVWVIGGAIWREMDEQDPRKILVFEVSTGLRRDWSALRQKARARLVKIRPED